MVAGYEPSEAKAKCPDSELHSNETVWQTGRVFTPFYIWLYPSSIPR